MESSEARPAELFDGSSFAALDKAREEGLIGLSNASKILKEEISKPAPRAGFIIWLLQNFTFSSAELGNALLSIPTNFIPNVPLELIEKADEVTQQKLHYLFTYILATIESRTRKMDILADLLLHDPERKKYPLLWWRLPSEKPRLDEVDLVKLENELRDVAKLSETYEKCFGKEFIQRDSRFLVNTAFYEGLLQLIVCL
jgi:hypothetical protein